MSLVNEIRVQRFKVKRRGEVSLRPTGGFFYKYCLHIPKDIVNGMQPRSGQTMYIEHAGGTCTMRTERRNEGDYEVKINEIGTRWYNGKQYTATRFVLPAWLAAILNIDKGDMVEVYEPRDGIKLTF